MRVLVAEDDAALRAVLDRGLQENDYVVDAVADGDAAVNHLLTYEYAVAILDWRMPKKSGIEVLEEARRIGLRTPILMLTARDTPADRVSGLNSGADDYLSEAVRLLRTAGSASGPAASSGASDSAPCFKLAISDLIQPPENSTRGDDRIALTATECALVELLLRRSPAVITRRTIAVQVWDQEADAVGSNTIEVHIARLRAKLKDSHAHIETVRGSGYRLVES